MRLEGAHLAQSSHICDGGCSLIFSWKGCCNIDKEQFVNLNMPFSPDPPPASVSERLCLCYSVHVCGFSPSCVGFAAALCFFLGRFEELFIAACWSSEHVLRLLPPAHLISSRLPDS